jgi:hypothetical protein
MLHWLDCSMQSLQVCKSQCLWCAFLCGVIHGTAPLNIAVLAQLYLLMNCYWIILYQAYLIICYAIVSVL